QDDSFEIFEDRVVHYWSPMPAVHIKSTIIPLGQAHLRIHDIQTDKVLYVAEGGFSTTIEESSTFSDNKFAQIDTPLGSSSIRAIKGYDKADIVRPEVNTNVLYPRSIFPCLQAKIQPGQHCLICLITGAITPEQD
ncbi:MAG: DUF2264 C-terminal domain-containing protein, partial [Lactococcus garvieae]